MQIGDPCPFCRAPLELRRSPRPRQAGRPIYAYCPHDEAAWEIEPDARYATPRPDSWDGRTEAA